MGDLFLFIIELDGENIMKYVTGASLISEASSRELENKKIAYNAASEGIVLLKNDRHVLPLKKGKIALFGAGAILTVKGGTGSGEVNERHSVSILEGLQAAGYEITTMNWLREVEKEYLDEEVLMGEKFRKQGLLKILNTMNLFQSIKIPYGREITKEDVIASETDTAVYVVARQAGEGNDKKIEDGEFDLSEQENRNIRFLTENYKNVILVINSGSYMSINIIDEVDIPGVIWFAQQGTEGGHAFADILSGKVSPSGKLSDTWVKNYNDIPFADDYSYRSGDTSQEFYKEGIYVGYRYFDTFKVEPRYHFGFGLSYTDFEMNVVKQYFEGEKFVLEVKVKNIGKVSGKEVCQVYVSCPKGKLYKEYQRLVAFKKTRLLNAGEEEILKLSFEMDYCSSYDEETSSSILEKGIYVVRVGSSSHLTKVASHINIKNNIVVSKHKNICPLVKGFDVLDKNESKITLNKDVLSFEYERKKRENIICYYNAGTYHSTDVDLIMSKLRTKDLIDIVVGTGIKGMFNTKYIVCPGAVGMTTTKFVKKGLINVNLSDGPAGLRLLKRSAITSHKILPLRMVDYLMSFMNYFPNWVKRFLSPTKNDRVVYQYTTAFPVGTSLAQTWNEELVESVGKAISKEMSEFKVTYWLAPAMNIHRNPLCGRNFEYYSEDPVLTGKIASAIVRGVQSIEGNYATIKHFACNNQEDNRNKSNSNVYERSLREIYLRGFEIAVKEGHASSLMTSYNLVNGTYTPNSYDLINSVLRNEWGFSGVVMSDWYATGIESGTKIQLGYDHLALKAGNDLIMPGTSYNKKALKKALKNGLITKEDLVRAASNIIHQIVESKVAKDYPCDLFNKK